MRATLSTSAKTATRAWGSGFSLSQRQRDVLLVVLRLALGSLVLVVIGRSVSWRSVLELAEKAQPVYIGVAVLLLIPNLWLQHVKWKKLLRASWPETSGADAAASLLAGFALGLVTPGRYGEIGRGLFLPQLDKVQTAFLAALDKAVNLAVILLVGLLGWGWLLAVQQAMTATWALLALAAGLGAALLAACLAPALLVSVANRIRSRRLRTLSGRFNAMLWVRSTLRFRLGVLALSAAFYATFVIQFTLLVAAFAGGISASYPAAATAALLVKTLVPISFGDVGVREGSAVLVFARLGVVPAAAFDAAMLLFAVNVALPAVAGASLLLLRRRRGSPKGGE